MGFCGRGSARTKWLADSELGDASSWEAPFGDPIPITASRAEMPERDGTGSNGTDGRSLRSEPDRRLNSRHSSVGDRNFEKKGLDMAWGEMILQPR
jgi:hypothetical protein